MCEPCQKCGMVESRAFIGRPSCMWGEPDQYSEERKLELAKRGCFRFGIIQKDKIGP
jgi:hypothetical protein